jgi:putative transposase
MMIVQAIKKQKGRGISMDKSLAHTKWMCKYHIVFTPKYRRQVIYKRIKSDITKIIKDLCKYKGVEIIEGHAMPDHIHLLVSIPPKMSVSSFMGYFYRKKDFIERHFPNSLKFNDS